MARQTAGRRLGLLVLGSLAAAVAASAVIGSPTDARAEATPDRFSGGGYFRIMARPDLQGGTGKLGYWNLHGRLLNEGPYAALELRLALLPPVAGTKKVWTQVHAKIEGGAVATADPRGGSLADFRLSQLYAQAGNILFEDVTWQLGTLDTYFGDLGLYDLRVAQIFFGTIGLSARYNTDDIELLVGVGDTGFFLRREQYSTVLTGGGLLRWRVGPKFELGIGGEVMYEPKVAGSVYSPHATPFVGTINYEDWFRREVVRTYEQDSPGAIDQFPRPEPQSNLSYRGVFYLGFGAGPIRWNNFYASLQRLNSEQFHTEIANDGTEIPIYANAVTNDRYMLTLGNEMQVELIPGRLDLAWGLLFGHHWDLDNTIGPTDFDRTFASTVVRLQAYFNDTVHLLLETSLAREVSNQGNQYRSHAESVFQSTDGLSDVRGLEYGDSAIRDTWQLKVGPVLSPLGLGVYTRPSFRLLYGLQWSSQINAFPSNFVEDLDQYNAFGSANNRWHHLLALEVEAWF